jgi:RNA polymerase primary sigma factor
MSTFDPIRDYLNAIGQIPLLTHDEELMLGRSIQTWKDNRQSDNPCPRTARRGKRALDRMVKGNLRLVVSVSRKYLGRAYTITLMDLIQEGNLGLIRAAERFDPARGYKFSTYATWWIRQAMARALAQNDRIVRIPTNAHDILNNLRYFVWEFRQKHDRMPSLQECAIESGVTAESLRFYLLHGNNTKSLDQTIKGRKGAEDGATLHCFVAADAPDPLDAVEISMLQEKLDGWKENLTELQLSIINRRFGLEGHQPETLATIGRDLGVSREAVRLQEQRGLRKMRLASALSAAA